MSYLIYNNFRPKNICYGNKFGRWWKFGSRSLIDLDGTDTYADLRNLFSFPSTISSNAGTNNKVNNAIKNYFGFSYTTVEAEVKDTNSNGTYIFKSKWACDFFIVSHIAIGYPENKITIYLKEYDTGKVKAKMRLWRSVELFTDKYHTQGWVEDIEVINTESNPDTNPSIIGYDGSDFYIGTLYGDKESRKATYDKPLYIEVEMVYKASQISGTSLYINHANYYKGIRQINN